MKGVDIDRTSSSAYHKALMARYENVKMASWSDNQNTKTAMEAIKANKQARLGNG